jgi:O-succinylbenzoic acid--CoA ligase
LNQSSYIIYKDISRKKEVEEFLNSWYDQKEYVIIHTSGSTGEPKPIKLNKKSMIRSAKRTNDYFKFKEHSTFFNCLSCTTIAGVMMIIRALEGNHNIMIGPVNNNPLNEIHEKIDFIAMVPYQLPSTLEGLSRGKTTIENLLIGGGTISPKLEEKIKSLPNHTLFFHSYGMTETISHIAMRNISEDRPNHYTLLDGVNMGVDDRSCIWILDSYTNNKIIQTNDIIEKINDRTFIWIGRWDNVINSGGKKFFPEKIEQKLMNSIGVEFFIGAVPHETLGEQITLFTTSSNFVLRKEDFSKLLTAYETPKEIRILDHFIFTPNGKLDRMTSMKKEPLVIKKVL